MMGSSYSGFPKLDNWWSSDSKWLWQERFIWWPRNSHVSDKTIWLTKAWYGYRHVYGPAGENPVKLEKWMTGEEYVLHLLKGDHAGN